MEPRSDESLAHVISDGVCTLYKGGFLGLFPHLMVSMDSLEENKTIEKNPSPISLFVVEILQFEICPYANMDFWHFCYLE